ncbi:hypothetical protein [Actinoalloteichus caeruleus]|uniref:Rho termination factor N-terminal domain-containing protein n=1 Tax=Actinoalloteichus caeruleus DSM 43889 TaxID=1120930 RepID=A0ABT1JDJ3_ACTCY|nr:hypothetical protein [Actinoalloteichus caeruleus]MCP2330570.1 hypothetical protein [Actinoalloteichus caeruleus DSM 43889]
MTELRRLIALNARWNEFLENQDEATLDALIDGAIRLTTTNVEGIRDDAAQRGGAPTTSPPEGDVLSPDDPRQVTSTLSALTSENDRRAYLDTLRLTVKQLRAVAKLRGLTRYSGLTRAALITLLASGGPERDDTDTAHPGTPPGDEPTATQTGQHHAPAAPRSSTPSSTGGAPVVEVDAAAIATRLRRTETEEDGAAYLDAQGLDREGLLAVAAELRLTRMDRLSRTELRRRVLKQAIGARRKFAGLRKW